MDKLKDAVIIQETDGHARMNISFLLLDTIVAALAQLSLLKEKSE